MNQKTMKILHENNFGHVAKCPCCEEFQLILGNVLLTFSENDYLQFDNFFDEIRADIVTEKPRTNSKRKYVIVTNYNGLVLSLTYSELLKTMELLNFSTMMISVNNLMSPSENN
tara:strand:- start:5301 stop:5642 length:342 start_codon:yes stop_codon:yes gene_type:complete